jgi:hypothetical protein
MSDQTGAGSVRPFAPRPEELLERIRRVAKESKNVGFSTHAEDRMDERGITDLDVLRVLRSGDIKGEVEAGRSEGEWKAKVTAPIKGRREVGVVVLVIHNRKLRVKTVEWEDLR